MQRTLRAPVRFDKEFQTVLDQISPRAHTEVLTLMIKQQKKNLAGDNEVIEAQQQLLQDLYPDQQSSLETTNHAANRARPRSRPPKLYLRQFSKLIISLLCKLNYLSYRKCFVKSVKQSM